MKHLGLAIAVSLGAVSCADGSHQSYEQSQQGEETASIGSLSLNLTGADSLGRQYRLRNASFYITSDYYYPYGEMQPGFPAPFPGNDGGVGFSTTVSTEDDPDASEISLRLVPGSYFVALEGDWYVERLTPTGPERVEQVVLLTEQYQYAYVYHNGVSNVAFRFGIDGELIDFRHGDLVIDAEFELPGDSDYPYPTDGGPGMPPTSRDAGSDTVQDAGVAPMQ